MFLFIFLSNVYFHFYELGDLIGLKNLSYLFSHLIFLEAGSFYDKKKELWFNILCKSTTIQQIQQM